MQVTVKLFAYLREGRFKVKEMEFAEGTTVEDVLNLLSIPKKELEIGIMMINGKRTSFDGALHEYDTLAIFPPVAGG